MPVTLIAYHGTQPGAPLVGGQDPVSRKTLDCLWVSNSYFLAAQFQDGEVRKLAVRLENPLVIRPGDETSFGGVWRGHAALVAEALAEVRAGRADWDGVVFIDTVDGMETGDVAAIFPRPQDPDSLSADPSVDHCVSLLGVRRYDHDREAWVSGPGFDADIDALPQRSSWRLD